MPPTEKQVNYAKALGIEANFWALSRAEVARLIEQRKIDIENGRAERPAQHPKRRAAQRRRGGDGYEQWGEDAGWVRRAEESRYDGTDF